MIKRIREEFTTSQLDFFPMKHTLKIKKKKKYQRY